MQGSPLTFLGEKKNSVCKITLLLPLYSPLRFEVFNKNPLKFLMYRNFNEY